ncbi:MAG: SDR family oxidoreductase [Methylococcaceae bacterium]|nr:MAG: SDR family oxidoreductase [Methylococcaceae bacterium]
MPIVLVSGANRGLGLEFCRQYAAAGWHTIATCRQPDRAPALQALADSHANLEIHALDVADCAGIDRLAAQLSGLAIDVLLNNAGVYGDNSGNGFGSLDYEQWQRVLRINSLGPVKMAEAFIDHVQRSERKLIVAVTSLMGSMADNGSGGSLMYRSSKAALNASVRSLALDLRPRRVGLLLVHPGWVRTDMGGMEAPLSVEASVNGMRCLIENFDLRHSGDFVDYLGKPLPW